jgi:hypothetical protein
VNLRRASITTAANAAETDMDKIKKHKFWILCGLVLPMALAGFFMANGGIKSATAERVAALEALQPPNAAQPNHTHTEIAKKRADQLERENAAQLVRLDQTQRAWMKWPRLIAEGLARDPATGEIAYRSEEYADQLRLNRIRVQYPDEYLREMQRVWLSAHPVVPSGLPYSDQSKKKVFFPVEAIPVHKLPQTPSVQEMWDAQEDIWILEMLIAAINQTNESATNVNDAAIREIFFIELFGGTGESTVVAAPAAGSESYMGGDPGYMTDPGAGSLPGAGVTVAFANGGISYDPQEEYGSQANTAAGPTDESYMDAGGLFGSDGAAAAKPLRYIGFDEAAPGDYRRRGYMIALLIQEKKIPDLIVNLGNLDPPVYAGRWGMANNPYDTDHLLKAGFANVGRGYEQDYSSDYSSTQGGAGIGRPVPRRGAAAGGGDYSADYNPGAATGSSILGVNDPRARQLMPAQLMELQTFEAAKLGKDLVQITLSGVVTIFTPNVSVPPPAEETDAAPAGAAPAGDAPPVDPAAPATVVPVDPAAPPATEPGAPTEPAAPPTAAESAAPPAAPATPATDEPVPPASPPPAAEAPAIPPPAASPGEPPVPSVPPPGEAPPPAGTSGG